MEAHEGVDESAWIDLYWLPLGAGGSVVRRCGRVYERWAAWRQHRRTADLYHSGLMVHLGGVDYAVEMGPVWNLRDPDRGVVCEGAVASPRLGRLRAFRYEIRCWPSGHLPDAAEAVESPVRVSAVSAEAADLLEVLREVPTLTWGRDEARTGEMWNSNSMISWALARSVRDLAGTGPPRHGRAPGWDAGLVLARRHGDCADVAARARN